MEPTQKFDNKQIETSKKILLMDDDDTICLAFKSLLEQSGYHVITCNQGEEAISLFKSAMANNAPFTLVILDLNIPDGLGGLETIKELRKIDPMVKGIVASGVSDGNIMAEYKNYGFQAVVEKPFKIEDLENSIKWLISEAD